MEHNLKVVEYAGPVIDVMSMSQRAVLTNMAAELRAETALILPHAKTLADVRAAGRAGRGVGNLAVRPSRKV